MSRFFRAIFLIGFAGWAMLWIVAPVLAQEGETSPVDTLAGQIFHWINFAIVLGLIIWGFRKAGPYFQRHAEEIAEKISEGKRAREAAEARRREAEVKMANLPAEVTRLRAEAQRDWEAESVRLRAQSKEEAEKIERSAEAEIAAAEREARMELKALAARLAVERAETLLRGEITPKTESALLQAFVAELERRAN